MKKFLIYIIIFLTYIPNLFSQGSPNNQGEETITEVKKYEGEVKDKLDDINSILDKIDRLKEINYTIDKIEDEIKSKRKELRNLKDNPESALFREKLTEEIQQLENKVSSLKKNFNEIALGIDLASFTQEKKEESEIDWQKELKNILKPLLDEVKKITQRIRESALLEASKLEYEKKNAIIRKAIANIDDLTIENLKTSLQEIKELKEKYKDLPPDTIDQSVIERFNNLTKETSLINRFNDLKKEWEYQLQYNNMQKAIIEEKLNQREREKKSITETIKVIFFDFLSGRGRNLLLAILSALLCWLIFYRLNILFLKLSTTLRNKNTFLARLFNIVYTFLGSISAVLVFIIVLYFKEDWVLLILTILFLLGVIWTSKQAIPIFWSHITLLLNIGGVREGERIIYNGLPWLVKNLNLHAQLINPALTGGDIRLPLADLLEMRSREYKENEPWFPTKEGDIIILEDQTAGKVVLQTPEFVQIAGIGGSIKTYPTQSFLSKNPLVLSGGFGLRIIFGLDYNLQKEITNEIPKKLEENIRKILSKDYEKTLKNLKVDFNEAASSSLNLLIIADFTGEVASDYWTLKRLISRICVDTCNEYGWTIPFNQLTVHVVNE